MKKVFVFLKKHAAALCACVLMGMLALSAVWLRSSGIEKIFSEKDQYFQPVNLQNSGEAERVFYPPAVGKVIVPYSVEALQYNPTTRVYEIHSGTDFLCPDENVHCVMDGRVEDVFFDRLFGNTIIVLHENGDKSLYASLSQTHVRKGDYVKAGEVIGKSGMSAAVEEKTGPHLHFEYLKNGKSYPISFTTAPET